MDRRPPYPTRTLDATLAEELSRRLAVRALRAPWAPRWRSLALMAGPLALLPVLGWLIARQL